ncbi:DUF805 domain-containing protein [Hymenobacter sp. BT664]|uniref:DUF805 domain-containing protein n=1 Tax=Hymenobacter montanus TaxID=2771359 RepID=A0A927BEU9_9BACT|nr:DUF805 domain-containing protein [Hymenobacter montanus]MBD2768960.1 DUF805 domain-containing protein [Hymenobacter montanus]
MHYFLNALKTKYADFNGRARRAEFWYFMLFNAIISSVLGYIGALIFNTAWLSNLYSLVVFIPGTAVSIRRMHDVGKSGWFILIPIYNLILAATEGTRGPNEYGPDPKNVSVGNDLINPTI